MAVPQPQPQMSAGTAVDPAAWAGRSELGTISIADGVVSKIAARAAAENPGRRGCGGPDAGPRSPGRRPSGPARH
jgi:hypothetical protein